QGHEVLALRAEQLKGGSFAYDTPRRRGTLVRQTERVRRPECRVAFRERHHKQSGGPLEAGAVGRDGRDGEVVRSVATGGDGTPTRMPCNLSDLPSGRLVVETGAVGADGLVEGERAHARTSPCSSTTIVTLV